MIIRMHELAGPSQRALPLSLIQSEKRLLDDAVGAGGGHLLLDGAVCAGGGHVAHDGAVGSWGRHFG